MAIVVSGSSIQFNDGSIQSSSSKIIQFARSTYNTRTAWGDATGATIWTVTFSKLSSSSNLYVEVDLSMRNNYSDCLIHELQYAGSSWFQGTQPYDAGFSANSRPYHSTFWLTGITITGSNSFNLRWRTANSQAGNKPALIWNPNSSDDGRYTQEYSCMNIFEIAG